MLTDEQAQQIGASLQRGLTGVGMYALEAKPAMTASGDVLLTARIVVPAETLAEIGEQPVVKRQIEITVDRQELPPGRQQTLSAAVSALARQAGPPGHQG